MCPKCQGVTTVVKTEPMSTGGKARLRRCERDGRFWTHSLEKLDHWLPATAIDDSGNGSATAIAVGSQLPATLGDRGGLDQGLKSVPLKQSGGRARVEPPRFAEFWAVYPRRVARIKAVEAWIKRELDQHADLIIAAIGLQAPEFLTREPDKIPHAATWLNQERWKDEVDRRPRPVGRPALETFDQRRERAREEAAERESERMIFGENWK